MVGVGWALAEPPVNVGGYSVVVGRFLRGRCTRRGHDDGLVARTERGDDPCEWSSLEAAGTNSRSLLRFCVVPVASLPTVFFALLLALGLSLYLAPVIMLAALRYGIVDKPKPPLKLQKEPVPYLGGMVVFIAFLMALAVTFPFEPKVLAILLCASLVVSVGLIDDLGTLTPKDKFIGQTIAAIVLVKAGVRIEIDLLPSPMDELLSVFWMVTCMNAFNILDVSDGLAATAGIVGAAGALAIALLNGEPMVAAMAASLMGACLGFLRVNREPARMYLGDTGSMLLGALLGALAMIGRYSDKNALASWFVPLSLVAIPLFDLVLVVVARLLAGRPFYYGSPDHFAIRLRHHGWSPRRVARGAGVVGACVVTVGITSTQLEGAAAAVTLGGVSLLLVGLLLVVLLRFPPRTAAAITQPSLSSAPAETPAPPQSA